MLDPEVYLEEALEKQRLRASYRCARQQLNFHKLNTERMIVPITINVRVREDLSIRDRFDWDLNKQYKSPYVFAKRLAQSIPMSESEQEAIASSIVDQIIEHIEKYTIQTRTRIPRRLEENPANIPTCLQCNSILYNHDYCRACGVSLEKLRQKYNLNFNNTESKETEEDPGVPRQTERQRNLEYSRMRIEPALMGNRKICTSCGEANHSLSVECRNCRKPLASGSTKIKNKYRARAYYFWRLVNKEGQFAEMVLKNDNLKEEDFQSAFTLCEKLKSVIKDCEFPPINESAFKVGKMLEHIDLCYQKFLSGENTEALYVPPKSESNKIDLKDLDLAAINSMPAPEMLAAYSMPSMMKFDQRYKEYKAEQQGRRRGRPRKYPLPETVMRETLEAQEEKVQVKFKTEDDEHMNECGICGNSGELMCCDVCPSVYHLSCLTMRNPPKGKWLCLYCRIVRDGLEKAMEGDPLAGRLSNMIKKFSQWMEQALQVLNILLMHPCSRILQSAHPKLETPPPDLNSVKELLIEGHYKSIEDIDADIRQIFKTSSKYFKKKNISNYKQVFNIQIFHNKLLSELQRVAGVNINTQPINFSSKGEPHKKPKLDPSQS